jgi:hypothetical protein
LPRLSLFPLFKHHLLPRPFPLLLRHRGPSRPTAPIGVPTQTASRSPSRTLAATLPPTETSTSTVTAEPTPIIAIIRASEGGGAFIREKPGGIVLATLGNGSTVTIIPNDLQDVNNVIWVHVFALVNDVRVEGVDDPIGITNRNSSCGLAAFANTLDALGVPLQSIPNRTPPSCIGRKCKGTCRRLEHFRIHQRKILCPIHFGTDGWRAVISDSFTFDNLRIVAQAIADAVASDHWDKSGNGGQAPDPNKDRDRLRHALPLG